MFVDDRDSFTYNKNRLKTLLYPIIPFFSIYISANIQNMSMVFINKNIKKQNNTYYALLFL